MADPLSTQWKDIALHILERNGAVSLSPLSMEDPNHSDELTFGSRLLDLSDRHLVVEVPNAAIAKQQFQTGARVYVVMVQRATRVELCCEIRDRVKVAINANVQTIGYELSLPIHVGSAQRREYYRAHVTALRIKPVKFIPMDPVLKHPMHELAFTGNMVNISGGGMGVIVHKEHVPILRDSKFFDCDIQLPMDKEQIKFSIQCQSMHSTAGRKGDVYVGLEFVITDPAHKREIVDKLVKYTTYVQREHLRHEHRNL